MNRNFENLEPGDYVRDPLDGEIREVTNIVGTTVYLGDGGIMALAECNDILLPSEVD